MLTRALILLAVVGSATPVLAQGSEVARSKTTGFMLGLGVNGSGIQFNDDKDADDGGGATLQVGYGFTRRFTGMIDVSGAWLRGDPGEGEVSLAQVFLAGRAHFWKPAARWIPFLDLGLGARRRDQNDAQVCSPGGCAPRDITFSGRAWMFGGGASFYATPGLAITTGLNWAYGEFTDKKTDNVMVSGYEADATTFRVNVGITWFPHHP